MFSVIQIVSTILVLIVKQTQATCDYSSCPPTSLDFLNVHLIPHSHDDLGWLKTVDQYYYQDVRNVIGSIVEALNQNPNRTFIQVETAYFKKWWETQNDIVKQNVFNLVNSGQLEFINGGWCMNDEAIVNYQSTIDQYTLGLKFLGETFGVCGRPKISWQIDTFGHSREQASISAQLGFDGFLFMRLDYRDRNKRLEEKTADLLWKGSQSVNSSTIFTSVFYRGTYSYPSGFCFDIVCNDNPIIDDEDSPDYNYEQRINDFADFVKEQASKFPTNNILVPVGDDVRYQAAFTNYLNIDRLIKGFELFPQTFNNKTIKLFYSTPSCYTKAVNDFVTSNNYQLDIKTDDFLPYATDGYGYWSGFYTARPSTKRFERQGNNFLQIAKQLTAITNQNDEEIRLLKEAVAVLQHHDAITGTEKQAVLHDYHRMLYAALENAGKAMDPILTELIGGNSSQSFQFKPCVMANISSCNPSRSNKFTIVVYNPLSRIVSSPIELPVNFQTWHIVDPDGNSVSYQVESSIIDFSYVTNVPTSPYALNFIAKYLPPLGYKVFTLTQTETPRTHTFGTSNTNFEIDEDSGLLKSITMNNLTLEVSQDLYFYKSGSYSGAYIFVPLVNEKFRVAKSKVKTTPIFGDVYQGVVQEFDSWAKQIIKVYNEEDDYIEIEWVIGPIDMKDENGDENGKEVVSVFSTSLETNGEFWTDSNGREMLKRKKNYRPTFDYTNEEPIAGNYHPITSRIVLKDEKQNVEFAVLNDRAQGGTSLEDGQLEIMIQRACPHHDFVASGRVSDNINDQEYGQGVITRGKHYLILGPKSGNGKKSLAAIQRDVAQRKLLPPWTFVTNQDVSQLLQNKQFSSLKRPLDENVQILTLEPWNDGVVLLRLEHILEVGEDENLSKEVTVDLSDLFTTFIIKEIKEMTLGANMPIDDKKRLEWPGIDSDSKSPKIVDYKVTLSPMQIRTFLVAVDKN